LAVTLKDIDARRARKRRPPARGGR